MLSVVIRGLSKRQVKLIKALLDEEAPMDPRNPRFDKIPKRELKQLQRMALVEFDNKGKVILPYMKEEAGSP